MSQEDAELLKAVKEWRPPTALHPIAMFAWNLYEEAGMTVSTEVVQTLRERLDAERVDLKALAESMEGLTRFLIYVGDQKGDVASGQKIAELMREYAPLFEPFWERVAEAIQNVGDESKNAFTKFNDQTVQKRAGPVNAVAPKGTLPLSALTPPARPPPWARKKNISAK